MKKTEDPVELNPEWVQLVIEAKRLGFTPGQVRSVLHQVGDIAATQEHSSRHAPEPTEDSAKSTVE